MDLFWIIVGIGVAALIVILAIQAFRRSKNREEVAETSKRADEDMERPGEVYRKTVKTHTPNDVKIGWYINHPDFGGQPQEVVGIVTIREGGYRWEELYIEGFDGKRRWLSIEQVDGDWEYVSWFSVSESDYNRDDDELVYDGRVYKLDEGGSATYVAVGKTDLGDIPSGKVKYRDYDCKTDERKVFSLEAFNGDKWEASAGTVLMPSAVTLEPAPVGFQN